MTRESTIKKALDAALSAKYESSGRVKHSQNEEEWQIQQRHIINTLREKLREAASAGTR